MDTSSSIELAGTDRECLDWFTHLIEKVNRTLPGQEELNVTAWSRAWFDSAFLGRAAPELTSERQVALLVTALRMCVDEVRDELGLERRSDEKEEPPR